jgi:hypothetical protein
VFLIDASRTALESRASLIATCTLAKVIRSSWLIAPADEGAPAGVCARAATGNAAASATSAALATMGERRTVTPEMLAKMMERAAATGRSDLIFEKRTPGVNPL